MRKKFTLVELLITIAIIAILASMLLPALRRAREASKAIACLNNIRQINMVVSNYESDKGDIIMPGCFISNYWGEMLRVDGYFTGIPLYNNVLEPVIMSCPAETRTRTNGSYTFQHAHVNANYAYDYSTNERISKIILTAPPFQPPRYVKVKKPSAIMKLQDAKYYTMDYYQTAKHLDSLRHNGRANVLFIDGHTGSIKDIPTAWTNDYWAGPNAMY